MFPVSLTSTLRRSKGNANAHYIPRFLLHYVCGGVTKENEGLDWSWAGTAAHRLGTPEGRDLSPGASPGKLTRRPLTPPPGRLSCSEPQSKTKGRGEEGASVPSNHCCCPSLSPRPPAAPCRVLRLAVDRGLGGP